MLSVERAREWVSHGFGVPGRRSVGRSVAPWLTGWLAVAVWLFGGGWIIGRAQKISPVVGAAEARLRP